MDCVQSVAGVHQQPQHALFGRRTHLYMAMAMPPSPSPSPSPSGVSLRRPTHASLHVHVHVHGHCPRGISHASISDLRARSAQFQCLLGIALLWSGLPSVCTWILLGSGSRASAGHVHVRFLWPTRQLALNFSSSFIVYAFTYAPQTCSWPSAPSPPALPLPVALGTFPF